MSKFQELSSLIWNVADDVLRGLFKPHENGDVILPFVILRRLDCVIEPQKDEIYFQLDKPVEKLHKNKACSCLSGSSVRWTKKSS